MYEGRNDRGRDLLFTSHVDASTRRVKLGPTALTGFQPQVERLSVKRALR